MRPPTIRRPAWALATCLAATTIGNPATAAPPVGYVESRGLVGPGYPDQDFTVGVSANGNQLVIGRHAGTNYQDGYAATLPVNSTSGFNVAFNGPGITQLYGIDVAMSADGSRYVIGAPDDSRYGPYVGALHVSGTGQNVTLAPTGLTIANGVAGIGVSVAMSADGTVVAGGAPAAGPSYYQGGAWVFTETAPGTWSTEQLIPSHTPASAMFGTDLAISSDAHRIAVSALGEEAVYIFDKTTTGWTETQRLAVGAGVRFGHDIALSGDGNWLAVGAPLDQEPGDNPSYVNSGAVYVFDLRNTIVPGPARLTSTAAGYTAHPGEEYGRSVAFDQTGEHLLVGAPGSVDEVTDTLNAGAVFIATRTTAGWPQTKHYPADRTRLSTFGHSVAISADGRVLIISSFTPSATGDDPLYIWRLPAPPPPPPSPCLSPTVTGTPADDILRGTNGNDVIDGGSGNDMIDGRGGDDLICGGQGDDDISGSGGADIMWGEDGTDQIHGGAGADTAYGGAGDDTLDGNAHDDTLDGGTGNNLIDGGAATDRCWNATQIQRCELGAPDA